MGGSKKINLANAEFSNPAQLLKERLKKKTANNKEKKSLMDMYVRNVKVIEDAFDQIKEATGISSIEEIVTTFIKSEEQNNSLFNYVNMFNSEIDMINEQNLTIRQEIEAHEKQGALTEQQKEQVKSKMEKEIGDMKSRITEKESQIDMMETELSGIKGSVEGMVTKFGKSKFFLSVAQGMQYDEDTQFNEGNVTMYLGELEEYISQLITFTAFQQNSQEAAIASLSLDKMANKEFDKGQINIDAPMADEIKMNEEAVAETDDEMITNAKELYRRFEDMVQNESISIGPSGFNNSMSKGASMIK